MAGLVEESIRRGATDQPEGGERAAGQAEARPASAPGRGAVTIEGRGSSPNITTRAASNNPTIVATTSVPLATLVNNFTLGQGLSNTRVGVNGVIPA